MRFAWSAKNIIAVAVIVFLFCFSFGLLFYKIDDISSQGLVLEGEISLLIDDLTKNSDSQDAAVARLVAMGGAAVPYIVSHLGDMRPLATRQVKLPNNYPGARERFRTYEAEVVHEALSDLLNEITGEHFPTFQDGATLEQRMENRHRWVKWCIARYPQFGETCKGADSANREVGARAISSELVSQGKKPYIPKTVAQLVNATALRRRMPFSTL